MRRLAALMIGTVCCILFASCAKEAPKGVPETIDGFIAAFNECAADTDLALGETADAADGSITVATKSEDSSVLCTEEDGALKKVEIEGAGVFQPGLPSYDYMVYSMMACGGGDDYTSAGDIIASMYYEAYTGGDAVVMAYNGARYSFLKQAYYCVLTIEPDTGEGARSEAP